MPSNQHFGVDVLYVNLENERPFPVRRFFESLSEPPKDQKNPFGDRVKKWNVVDFQKERWLVGKNLSEVKYDEMGYQIDGYRFDLSVGFDAAVYISQIDPEKFGYSVATKIAGLKRLKLQPQLQAGDKGMYGIIASIEHPEEGSIRQTIGVVVVTAGSFVGFYPELKQGLKEIYTDVSWLGDQLETAIRSAKIPDDPMGHDEEILAIIERRRNINRDSNT
jgi:hypothetical protein